MQGKNLGILSGDRSIGYSGKKGRGKRALTRGAGLSAGTRRGSGVRGRPGREARLGPCWAMREEEVARWAAHGRKNWTAGRRGKMDWAERGRRAERVGRVRGGKEGKLGPHEGGKGGGPWGKEEEENGPAGLGLGFFSYFFSFLISKLHSNY